MSKRRISDQQSTRIEKKHALYRQQTDSKNYSATEDGLIITRFGSHAIVESNQGTRVHCSIRPSIDSLVAGDRVVWQPEGEQGVVVSCYPRKSVLGRPDKRGQVKAVAANISQLIIVVAPKPEISWSLLDCYLIMAEQLHLNACIVLNKIDLPCTQLQEKFQLYASLGYSILFTGQSDKTSYKSLQHVLNNQTSVFVGQSGVGKSSLIAHILPFEENIQIGPISTLAELGKHTTSASCLYHLPSGGALIDSPGIRELGLWHMPTSEIAKAYREFKPYLAQCKFRNCNHYDTVGCQIIAAVKNNLISQDRYKNYVKIATQFASNRT